MSAGSKPLRPWQVCAGDVIGSGKRVEYVFERYGELYINASDEELVRQGKRTYIVRESGTGAKAYVIVNNFYAYGTLDRQLVEYLEGEEVPIIAKIPRAVALSRAAAAGVSVAEYDPKSHVVAPIELLADSVLNEEEKNNG